MVMSEKMFITVSSFLFWYCVGYYLFELVKSKNRKYEIHDFFLNYNKKMANSVESLIKQLEEVNINDDCFLGKDLPYQKKFLEKIEEKIEKEIPGFEISYFFRKGSMALCFEISSTNEKIAKDLLLKIDWLMDEHFFKKNGLRELDGVQSIYSIEEVLIIIKISKNSKKLK